MTFNPKDIERLRELGRQLPKKLPTPNIPPQSKFQNKQKLHAIETEENPQALFREIMNASPDGSVPHHLINRLKEAEKTQLPQTNNDYLQEPSQSQLTTNQHSKTNLNQSKKDLLPKPRFKQGSKEELLYSSFQRLLLEEEDNI